MFPKSDSKSQELFYRRVKANRQPVNTLRQRKVFKPVGVGQTTVTLSGNTSQGGRTGVGNENGARHRRTPHLFQCFD
jgi:hypothetical protein